MTDDRPSPKEQAEAEALARALVSGGDGEVDPAAPDDAREAAALIGLDAAELSPDREAAVWERIQAGLPDPAADPRPAWRRWLLPVGSLAAAAAALVLVVAWPGAPAPTPLPRPEADLLQAQAQAAAGDRVAAARLERDMRSYRRDVYAKLRERYGGRS